MIKDYWVYQDRQNELHQWAIYIVKEYDKYKPESVSIDYTLYSEDIDNATHSKSKVNVHYNTVSGYVDDLLSEIMEFSAIDARDKAQLEKSMTRILTA